MMKRKQVLRILKWVILVYCTIGVLLYNFQNKLLFHPKKLPSDYKFNFSEKFSEINIPLNKTDTINLIHFFTPDSIRKGVVVYLHGNKENVERYEPYSKIFLENGYDVLMPDYPKFGKSKGVLSEESLYTVGIQTQQFAKSLVGEDSIIIYGKSLGTGVAAYVAANSKNKELILETPYASIPSLFKHHTFFIYPVKNMAKYKLPVVDYLKNVEEPVIIFAAENDRVVPSGCTEEIKNILKTNDQYFLIENADHQTINKQQSYFEKMKLLLK